MRGDPPGLVCTRDLCAQSKVRLDCVRPEMWAVAFRLVERVGRLAIIAGCDGRHAERSFHYTGRALDLQPLATSQAALAAAARSDPTVGGVIMEGTHVHVDVGDRAPGLRYVVAPGVRGFEPRRVGP